MAIYVDENANLTENENEAAVEATENTESEPIAPISMEESLKAHQKQKRRERVLVGGGFLLGAAAAVLYVKKLRPRMLEKREAMKAWKEQKRAEKKASREARKKAIDAQFEENSEG